MQNQHNDFQLGYLDEASYRAMLRAAARAYPRWRALGLDMDDYDPTFVRAVVAQRTAQQKTSDDDASIFAPVAPAAGEGQLSRD